MEALSFSFTFLNDDSVFIYDEKEGAGNFLLIGVWDFDLVMV